MDLYNSVNQGFNRIVVFLIFILYSISLGTEPPPPPQSAPVELYVGIINEVEDITFTLSALSTVWAAEDYDDPFLISEQYHYSQYTAFHTNTNIESWWGWDFVISHNSNSKNPVFAYGLYKLGINDAEYIYLDYRDDRYGNYINIGNPLGHDFDLWIKYESGDFYYSNDGNGPWVLANSEECIKIWEIKQMGNPTSNRFQPTTPTNLHYENANGHPRLSWNLSEPQEAATYEV